MNNTEQTTFKKPSFVSSHFLHMFLPRVVNLASGCRQYRTSILHLDTSSTSTYFYRIVKVTSDSAWDRNSVVVPSQDFAFPSLQDCRFILYASDA